MSSKSSITREIFSPSKITRFIYPTNTIPKPHNSSSDISNIETQMQSNGKSLPKIQEIIPQISLTESNIIENNTKFQANNPSITPSNIKNTTKINLSDIEIKNSIQKPKSKNIENIKNIKNNYENDFDFPILDSSQSIKESIKQSLNNQSCIKIEDKSVNQTIMNHEMENVYNTINFEQGGETQRTKDDKKDSVKINDINLNICIDEAPVQSIVKGIGVSENYNIGNEGNDNNIDNIDNSKKTKSNEIEVDVEAKMARTETFNEDDDIEGNINAEVKSDSINKSNNIEEINKSISCHKIDNIEGAEINNDNEINTNNPINNLKKSINSNNTSIKNKKPLTISIANSATKTIPNDLNIPLEANSINNDNSIKNTSNKILITIDSINQLTENDEIPETTNINNQDNSQKNKVSTNQKNQLNNPDNNSNCTLISISRTCQPKHIIQSSLCNPSTVNNAPNLYLTSPPPKPRIKIFAPNELSPLAANLMDIGPLYRHIKIKVYGLIIPGICNSVNCPGYNKEVLYQIGNVDGYDYVSEAKKDKYFCPLCRRKIKAKRKVGLFNCEYRIERRFGNGKNNKDSNNNFSYSKSNICHDANCLGIIEDQVMINRTKRMEVDFINFDKGVSNHCNENNNSYELDEKEILIWTYPLDGNNNGGGCIVF